MSTTISFLTLNVSGLQNKQKRNDILFWLNNHGVDISYIQETHCGSELNRTYWQCKQLMEGDYPNIVEIY